MKKLSIPTAVLVFGGLAACGGSGSNSNNSQALVEATSAQLLAEVENNDQGTGTVVDDTKASVNGYVVGEGALGGSNLSSATASINAGSATTVEIDGTTYTIASGSSVSGDGAFVIYGNGTLTGDYSIATVVGTGTGLGSSGTPDDVGAFIRGLVTPDANLPGAVSGGTDYTGTATLSQTGSATSETGTFGINVDFGSNAVSGNIDVGTFAGTVSGTQSGNELTGDITGTDIVDMTLQGNIFGPNGEELAGGASGTFDGTTTVIGLQGSR